MIMWTGLSRIVPPSLSSACVTSRSEMIPSSARPSLETTKAPTLCRGECSVRVFSVWLLLCSVMAHPPAAPLELSAEDRALLEEIASSPSKPTSRECVRPRACRRAAEGVANQQIAERLGVSRLFTVLEWRRQFEDDGVTKVGKVRPGRGRKPTIPAETVEAIVARTQNETPPDVTQWSVRSMAKTAGVGRSTVHKIWRARGPKPHLIKTFKLSNDPHFEDKLVDVVGLDLRPPDNAVVLSVDEKSQIQALDRTQPSRR